MSPSERFTDACRATLLILAVVAVGQAIHIRDGEYDGVAIRWIGVALAGMLAALLLPRLPGTEQRVRWSALVATSAIVLAVVICLIQLLRSPPSGWNQWSNDLKLDDERNLLIFRTGLGFAAAAAAVLLTTHLKWWVQAIAIVAVGPLVGLSTAYPISTGEAVAPVVANAVSRIAFHSLYTSAAAALLLVLGRKGRWAVSLVVVLVLHLLLGFWMVRSCPGPHIDVFVFQQLGGQALLSGDNPYAVTYPDIYADTAQAQDRDVYGTGLSREGQLAFGFPYPPLSLLLSTCGYWIGGDHRYDQAAALTLAGLLLAIARPGRWGAMAALLLLLTPRAFFILGRGWTEPFVVLLLALVVFTAYRKPRLLPIALGLFLASKQYLVFAVPLAWLLIPDPRNWRAALRLIGGALLVTAVVSLPLALWDLKSFWHSTVTVQQVAPFREDALSWLVWYYQRSPMNGVKPEAWVAFAVAIPMLIVALALCPRTPAGFALGLAAVYLPFIAFNKQAFANYYLFVIGAMVCALATLRPGIEDPAVTPTGPAGNTG